MSKERGSRIRNSLRSNPRDLSMVEISRQVSRRRGFFVAGFSVRRQLIPDKAAIDFSKCMQSYCAKKPYIPYELGAMGITILEKARFVSAFHDADVQPDAESILDLAVNVKDALRGAVKGNDRKLQVPIGNVAVFGARDNVITGIPLGWTGFKKRYAKTNEDGKTLHNRQLVREINSTVGEITQFIDGGIDSDGEYVDIDTSSLEKQSPHMSFAKKKRGSIENSERVNIQGELMELLPEDLSFFDPVIHLQLLTPGNIGNGYTNDPNKASIYSSGLYVRRPHFDSHGGAELEARVTRVAA